MTFNYKVTNNKFMKFPKQLLLLVGICFFCFISCTENPFWKEDNISGNSIRGKVKLENSSNPGNVYIWLEGFDISTRTKEDGSFDLIIPPPNKQPGNGIDGFYNLYFYVSNYRLYSIEIVFSKGAIVLSDGIFNNNGELKAPVNLSEILHITTSFKKGYVTEAGQDTLLAYFTIKSKSTSVSLSSYITNPIQGEREYLVGFLVDKDEKFLKKLEIGNRSYRPANWKLQNQTLKLPPVLFTFHPDSIKHGSYKIIPYLDIWHEHLPSGLLKGLKSNQFIDYLKIPLKINGNEFQI